MKKYQSTPSVFAFQTKARLCFDVAGSADENRSPLVVRFFFLSPLAKGQRAIVMALCPSCVRLSVRPPVSACVRP